MIANPYTESFLELSTKVNDAGLMRRRLGFYWPRILFWTLGTVLSLIVVALAGDGWYLLLFAVFLGVAMSQLGFLSHEAAHQEIFEDRRWNEWTSRVLAGLFIGLSYGWWVNKHSRHHANPNKERSDPDLNSRVLSLTPDSTDRRTGLAGKLSRYQGWYFLPLLPFEGFSLHVASVRTILGRGRIKFRWVEILFVGIRLLGIPIFLFIVLPFWLALAFIVVQTLVFGLLLGGAFAASHIGMPTVPHDVKLDFLRRQVHMSRNIRGSRLVRFFMGGLEYQIEHHLFPRTPRPNLPVLQKLVREHCSALGVPYTETTLGEAYGVIIAYLNQVGLKNRDPYTCPLVLRYRG
ncbi:fatty acid desaturase family protein [Corynebacterium comes]|uniref:Stearoyl-CoA 9-desaturase n=1 Tax=Corynebacterium comes TaxID=2675218 RepID=A0A6B8VVN7_9CORY|nr:acyl-CoA desaturase [Corynebacterium comes]QGU05404.1 Stearoyl-CoA 9-desaturase [Corynebacterium comes]